MFNRVFSRDAEHRTIHGRIAGEDEGWDAETHGCADTAGRRIVSGR